MLASIAKVFDHAIMPSHFVQGVAICCWVIREYVVFKRMQMIACVHPCNVMNHARSHATTGVYMIAKWRLIWIKDVGCVTHDLFDLIMRQIDACVIQAVTVGANFDGLAYSNVSGYYTGRTVGLASRLVKASRISACLFWIIA